MISLASEAQHGEQEVAAVRSVNPTGAKDEEFAPSALDGLLAGELAGAVNVERTGLVIFYPRTIFSAVENIVGGIVDEQSIALERLFSKDARRLRIDREGEIVFELGTIDCSIGGRVQNDIWLGATDEGTSLLGIGKID